MAALVCLSLSRSALCSMNSLYSGERHVVIWRAEEKALNEFKQYGENWADYKGKSGKWVQPTHRHKVTVFWRFVGVENNLPVFDIGLIECERIKKKSLVGSKRVEHFKRWMVIAIGLLGLLTILIQTYINFNTALAPFWELLVALFTWVAGILEDR